LFINAGGAISLTNSALIANQAAQDGGAIYNSGVISLSNMTVSGNSASGMGGGLANFDLVNLVNATFADNTSSNGAALFSASVVNIQNSLIALNDGDNCLGILNSQGHNLEDGGTCALGQPTDMSNTSPSMAPLGEYGGSTLTHALVADSPAIDAGDNSACPPTDQRGAPRPVDGDGDSQAICDIGAYEYGSVLSWVYLPLVMR
jgi:predicted outer membrane repeat protein